MLKSQLHLKKFLEDGYCVINIQNKNIVNDLDEFYNKAKINTKDIALYASNHYGEYNNNLWIQENIQQIVTDELNLHFYDYKFLIGHFLDKKPHSQIGLQLHQDWSITDEVNYLPAHIWIPHQYTFKKNGALYVWPQSHKYFNNFRSGSLDIPRIPEDFLLKKICKTVELDIGQMIIFHPGLFHGSYPNYTSDHRIATFVNIIQKDAPLFYYHLNQNNDIEQYTLTLIGLMSDLNKMIDNQIPEDSEFIRVVGKRTIENNMIGTKDLIKQLIKKKLKMF